MCLYVGTSIPDYLDRVEWSFLILLFMTNFWVVETEYLKQVVVVGVVGFGVGVVSRIKSLEFRQPFLSSSLVAQKELQKYHFKSQMNRGSVF